MVVPCQTPVVMVPTVVILPWVKCSPATNPVRLSWSRVPSKLAKVILPDPESVISTMAMKSPEAMVVSVVISLRSRDKVWAMFSPLVAPVESIPVPPTMVAV